MTFAAAIVLLAIVALIPTLKFPSAEEVSTFIGPRLWPLCLLVALLVLGSFLLATTWRSSRSEAVNNREESTSDPTNSEASTSTRSRTATHHWWLMLGTVAYTLLMQATGFLLATVVFTLFCTLLLGARHWGTILATVAVAAVLIQGVFSYLLGIPLP
ncbi:tripartite tricarboxylate transporter TctB family protein [Halomonas sp. McH1-25]|nr:MULTISPECIES: tripartite tricarboxylate transporter TctB family protein [unclassified Halomonas]MCG7600131.1 tripartite tricarboxylate transporter TctB family protein [Halomonas sp. McH1-25]MCP1341380.1 tripartite tricarboxylate transporter TctB family protein [Halomonas sp. FL8]MCP1359675.1 tripartite tricarboxylate transporter TctB family protein [Halomonas sp. BBD45]MCP1365852.1 tripartite tricarboxylate transporter TctB family protein [Halomonas sp. BBD48]